MDTLRAELVAVVDETMEPTRLSLWLRQPSANVWHLATAQVEDWRVIRS